jgi:hypothetical protein
MTSLPAYPVTGDQRTVHDIITAFLAGLKNLGLYAENHDICQRSLQTAFDRLGGFLQSAGKLKLDIASDRLLYRTETVYRDSDATGLLAYYLFRDGIKWISFNQGLTVDELKAFIMIFNRYRAIQEDPEGDLATALWEANFTGITYQASDIYWESEVSIDLRLPVSGSSATLLADPPDQVQQSSLVQGLLNPQGDMYQLTPAESARLQQMIAEEEKRDSAQDLLELASMILTDEGNRELLASLFQFIKTEIKNALAGSRFKSACRTLRTVHAIRSAAKTEGPWSIPQFNRLIISLSGPEYLKALPGVLRKIEKTDDDRFVLIGRFVLMLHSEALRSLAPMSDHFRSISVQQKFIKILEVMASRNLEILEKLLEDPDEKTVQWLVSIAARLPGSKPEEMVRKMTRHASARVRKQAVRCLLARDPASLSFLFAGIEDPDEDVRRIIFKHLKRERNRLGEELLLQYLQRGAFAVEGEEHVLNCYHALGRCGGSESIPFLEQVLFKNPWHQIFNGSVHRQGAVAALMALGIKETRRPLSKASRSFSPAVRWAYKKVKNDASPC